jgi:hypothetical protein
MQPTKKGIAEFIVSVRDSQVEGKGMSLIIEILGGPAYVREGKRRRH